MALIPFPNPLQNLSDEALYDAQLALELACGRNKAVTRDKHRTRLCTLAGILGLEADNRGKPQPTPPFKA